ncbi:lipoyl(octanoyl) transferase LipB [Endozoicomonas lisbonensis]|uniref:Octanoyltransferase n=1 Tax=Endozoicomonas lisbonensis TaxID=3120522 RepID=A0ABV2SJQ5_9GAMM
MPVTEGEADIMDVDAVGQALPLNVRMLGRQAYEPVWQAMKTFTETRDETTVDELWFVEHDPVFTQGQAGKAEHVLNPGTIPVVQVDRGGQVTYHGPGQLVVYLLLDVKRSQKGPRAIVSGIEQAIINVLQTYGVESCARPEAPGVYIRNAKIAALGLRFRKQRSYHGLSFNLDMDLEPFSRINPCGYEGLEVTQLIDYVEYFDKQDVAGKLLLSLMEELGYCRIEKTDQGLP